MKQYEVRELFSGHTGKTSINVKVPGSKSITNRALLLATLAEGRSRLDGVLFSDDSRHFIECVKALGIETYVNEDAAEVIINGMGGKIPDLNAPVYVGSAGTAARFLAALLGISGGCHRMDASEQMRKRPMAPLIRTLRELGADISCEKEEGFFPFTVRGAVPQGKQELSVNIDNSSQFLSALLIAFGAYQGGAVINVEGTHGMAYIDMTIKMMEQFGVKVRQSGRTFELAGNSSYSAENYSIEPDVSAACYFYAMAPLLGISVTVEGIRSNSLQGDIQFIKLLEKMGCTCEETEKGICVSGPGDGVFRGIEADMHSFSDQAITLAALAPFASTPTVITGISHIRLQESNRIAAICTELSRAGIRCEEFEDGVRIWPGTPKPALIHTYDDHRMAMGFSLIGLRADGIVIDDPLCCRKTFEKYFDVLDSVIERITESDN